jgi:signal transduction histidine kinase
LPKNSFPPAPISRTQAIPLVAIYALCVAVVIRTLLRAEVRPVLPLYLAFEFLFLVLFTLVMWRPLRLWGLSYLYFIIQSVLVLSLYLRVPKFDFVMVLFNVLSFQAALVFSSRVRWLWPAVWALLTGLLLTISLGVFGLAIALLPITINFLFPAYISVNLEVETELQKSQALLKEVQAANQQLTIYASQVEELAVIEEHNRLARDLHNSVLQTISKITPLSQSARELLADDTKGLDSLLEQLQSLAQIGLDQMRVLIANLRPPEDDPAERPTS